MYTGTRLTMAIHRLLLSRFFLREGDVCTQANMLIARRSSIGCKSVECWWSIGWVLTNVSIDHQSTVSWHLVAIVSVVCWQCSIRMYWWCIGRGWWVLRETCILIKLCGAKCQLQFCEVQCNQFFPRTCFAHSWMPYFLVRKFLFRS